MSALSTGVVGFSRSRSPAVRLMRGALATIVAAALVGSAAVARAADEEDDTKPQDITLKTKDGVELRTTFYPTILKKKAEKKEAVPLILLHAWKGDRGDCAALANYLQSLGHAVITPDLRGHGDSKTQVLPNGERIALEANTLRLDDFKAMCYAYGDLEAVKAFLLKRHNDAELNIDRLGVVGAEMGASVAIIWSALDWAWPVLATGKQGQDVKALVLISPPEPNFKSLNITQGLQMPPDAPVGRELSLLIAVGKAKGNKVYKDTLKLEQTIKPYHPEPPPDEVSTRKTLFFQPYETSLQGTKLLSEGMKQLDDPKATIRLPQHIAKFIEYRLQNLKIEWEERKDPLQGK